MSDTPAIQTIPDSRHRLEAELRGVMLELDELVEPIRWEAARNRRGQGVRPGWMAICGGLAMLAILSVGSLFQALDDRSWFRAIVVLLLGTVAAYEMARLWPRAAPEIHRLSRRRRALLARKKRLEDLLAGNPADMFDSPIVTDATPTPKIRRPTDFAQVLWHSGGRLLGPSPTDALRNLPEGASWFRLAFHRYLGWGFPIMLLVLLAILALALTTT